MTVWDNLKSRLWSRDAAAPKAVERPAINDAEAERAFLKDLRKVVGAPGSSEEPFDRLMKRCARDLGISGKDMAFLVDADPDETTRELQRISKVWALALAGSAPDSARPRVAILISDGQAIRSFLLTDVCRKIVAWAQLYVLSTHDIAADVAALGPNACFLPIPALRRTRFDYMVGYLGYKETDSPTSRQFAFRLDENLNRALEKRSKLDRTLRIWKIARDVRSRQPFVELYRWSLRLFAKLHGLDQASQLLARLKPDVVFNTSAASWPQRLWTRAAAVSGIPIISNVISWDNISTKTLLDEFVDTFLIWSEEMDEDFATNLPWLRKKRRLIVGSPQFEPIIESRGLQSRAEFFARYGVDPGKKLVLYTTGSKTLFPREAECLDAVLGHWRDHLRERTNVMVRMHPKDRQGRYEAVMAKFPDVPFTLAGENLASDDEWLPTKDDMALLINQLHHCDVVVNVASTMTLEGFAIDKPAINIGFTLGESKSARYPMDDYYVSRHYRDVVETGAARFVRDYDELFKAIADALDGNGHDIDKQKAIFWKKCNYTTDSSDRISEFLRSYAGQPRRDEPIKVAS